MSERRRTGFEKDLRETLLKSVLGVFLGLGIRVWTEMDSWWYPILLGVITVFAVAFLIRGDAENADKG